MNKLFLFPSILIISIVLFSCKKETVLSTDSETPGLTAARPASIYSRTGSGDGDTTSIPPVVPNIVIATAFAGQTINAGTITITNDSAFIYVTYNMVNGYTLTQTHLFVGPVALIPTNHPGNPQPGQFPYATNHNNVTSFTYKVPVSLIGNNTCGAIAAHGTVQKLDASGHVVDSQSIWGNGPRINGAANGNWAMYTPFCVQY